MSGPRSPGDDGSDGSGVSTSDGALSRRRLLASMGASALDGAVGGA